MLRCNLFVGLTDSHRTLPVKCQPQILILHPVSWLWDTLLLNPSHAELFGEHLQIYLHFSLSKSITVILLFEIDTVSPFIQTRINFNPIMNK